MKVFFLLISILLHSFLFIKIEKNDINNKKSSYSIKVKIVSTNSGTKILKKKRSSKGTSLSNKKTVSSPNKVVNKTNDLNGNDLSPKYPWRSKVLKEEGKVTLGIKIHPSGKVSDISIIKSSGYGRLDQAAIDSISKLKVDPTQLSKEEFKKVTFDFRLN